MKILSVFTPTYNRAYTLPKLYKSLLTQTAKKFIWLVIDDGSSDNTKELVVKWQKEAKIEIQYIYQDNQGMHGAHNTAYQNITTELSVCIDSDDYMPIDAVEKILNFWNKKGNDHVAGMVGLDIDKKGNIIGSKFPDSVKEAGLNELYRKYKVTGDKKLVLRTAVVKKYPSYPLFKNERFVPLGILYLMIDQDYKLLTLNQPLCVVEYMPDGSTLNIFKQYKKNPKGFRYARGMELKYLKGIKITTIKVLHYISSTLFIGDYRFFKDNPKKITTIFLIPLGLFFHLFILYKTKK
jgi:glycosyltransferase involved in cell wall biosynthesis